MRGFSNTSAARLMRLLCTQNPFYLISALVVLFGLRQCAAGTELTGGWLLMSVICGYASLLAAAVCIIIWWGRVWDDARMILLVLVLLFLALSVSFDRILLSAPWGGLQFLLFGLLFSVGLSEGVLRLLKMRLSLAYRLPYYVMLAVLFAYPLLLAWFSVLGYDRTLAWGVFLFPWVAAGTFLTLIPAARSGHRDRRPNGTPWTWPLYPWALFVFLWFCFALRTYWICYAFEAPRELQAEFAPHFLAPLVLAAAVLLLEIGIATGRRTVQQVAMLMPLGVVALALLGVGREQTRFIQLLQATVGSPAQLTCWMLLAFYGLGSLRRVRFGEAGLVGALMLCSVVDNQTLSLASLCWPQSLPINVAAALLVSLGIVQQRRWKAVFGGGLFALSSTMRDPMFAYELATLHHGYYVLHLGLLMLLLWAVLSDDRYSQAVRSCGVIVTPIAAWTATLAYDAVYPGMPAYVHVLYAIGLSAAAWGFWDRQQRPHELGAAMATSFAVALTPAKHLYWFLQSTLLAKALPYLLAGLILLGLAILVSFYKGGLLWRGWSALRRLNEQLRRQAIP